MYRFFSMKEKLSNRERVLGLLQQADKPLRAREILNAGIHPGDLYALRDEGVIDVVSRGLYQLTDRKERTEHTSLVAVAERVPRGVVCLRSALEFHKLTTQWPQEVWLAIERGAWRPNLDYPPLQVVVLSGAAFNEGIDEYTIEGAIVRVYSPAKTIVDCFKFRNKVGLDVALEALQEGWHSRRVSMDELWRYAAVCRQKNTIRPYLESLA
jgi:predicted transcriptional regulator of viral defense system